MRCCATSRATPECRRRRSEPSPSRSSCSVSSSSCAPRSPMPATKLLDEIAVSAYLTSDVTRAQVHRDRALSRARSARRIGAVRAQEAGSCGAARTHEGNDRHRAARPRIRCPTSSASRRATPTTFAAVAASVRRLSGVAKRRLRPEDRAAAAPARRRAPARRHRASSWCSSPSPASSSRTRFA